MLRETRIHELTGAFLEAQKESLLELSGEPLLPFHRILLDMAIASISGPSPPNHAPEVFRAVAGFERDPRALLPGQIALWSAIHQRIREVSGPHSDLTVLQSVLALAGDVIDAFTGVVIDACESGSPIAGPAALPRWSTLVELGRRHREYWMLHQIIHDLLGTRDPQRMFEILARSILGTFHLRSLSIGYIDRREGYLEIVQSHPCQPATGDPIGWRYDLQHPEIFCDVARKGRMEVVDGWDIRYHERVTEPDGRVVYRKRSPDGNWDSTAVFVPILAGDQVVGVLATASTQADKPLILREVERMTPFLHQAGATFAIVAEMAGRRRAERLAELSRELQETNRRLEEANQKIREAARLKAQFLANIAHELRTPMNAIVGFTNLVLRQAGERLPERHRENLVKVKLSSDHLLSLIQDVLDLSRMETGEVPLRPRSLDLEKVVASCCAAVGMLVPEGVNLRHRVAEDIGEIHADEARLREVLVELLDNALRFTKRGEVQVIVKRGTSNGRRETADDRRPMTRAVERSGESLEGRDGRDPANSFPRSPVAVPPSGDWLEIEVSDTGVGIPPEALDHIFEEFRQVNGNHSGHKGTGLGLAIVRKLVELMGGKIRAESTVGKGSRFTVILPRTFAQGGAT